MSNDLNLPTIADGQADQQWQTANDMTAAVADAVQDMYTVDFSGGNVTLTSAQFRSAMTFIPSGLSTGRDLTVPAVKRAQFIVHNTDSADAITVKRGATSVVVAAGKIAVLYTDGTANGLAGSVLSSGTGVGDVVGPGSATNNNIAVFDTTTGKLIKDGGATVASLATAASVVGKQTIWVPASAMTPATTNGPATGQIESTTNKVNVPVLDFDATTAEQAWFNIAFPKGWNEGTVTFQVFWASTATDTDGIAMSLAGISFADNETIDTALGTAVVVTDDAQSNSTELYVTSESSAVTIGGSPAVDELVAFRVQRVVSDGNDDMSEDMRLIGIKLFYTTDAANDA